MLCEIQLLLQSISKIINCSLMFIIINYEIKCLSYLLQLEPDIGIFVTKWHINGMIQLLMQSFSAMQRK